MVDAEKLAGAFKLLSVETRIRIVQALKRRASAASLTAGCSARSFINDWEVHL